jgi:P-type Cu+ transporter
MSTYAVAARPISYGTLAFAALIVVYFGILSLVSGWQFTVDQFSDFWYYIVPLGAGFGIQVALFVHLKHVVRGHHGGGVVAATGTTSTAAMISCCAHYLVNVAPIIGATGLVALLAQYQVQFFWVGLAFNAAGIVYIGRKVLLARRHA